MPPRSACASEARGQVHLVADDRVINAILAAEISDRAIASIDPNAKSEKGCCYPRPRHSACRSAMRSCMAMAIFNAGQCASLACTLVSGSAKKNSMDGVADELVDRGAILHGDIGHLIAGID